MADELGTSGAALDCEQWEALLADKMDLGQQGASLSSADEAAFLAHSAGCSLCGEMLEQALRGRQWLRLLGESAPPPPVDLLSKILARTAGAGHEQDFPIGTAAMAGIVPASHLPGARWAMPAMLPRVSPVMVERALHDARLLMTAAMAFFVVALTLSLLGFRLNTVKAAELKPQVLEANVTRQFYGTKKQVVSFYDNLRVVYEVEARMKQLRDARQESEPESKPAQAPLHSKPPTAPQQRQEVKPQGGRLIVPVAPGSSSQPETSESVRGVPAMACDRVPGIRNRAAEALVLSKSGNERSRA